MGSSYEGVLGPQTFSGSDLNRGLPTRTVFSGADYSTEYSHVRVILVADRKLFTRNPPFTIWCDRNDLHPLGFNFTRGGVGTPEFLYHKHPYHPSSSTITLPLYYLGRTQEITNRKGPPLYEYYVCDISEVRKKSPQAVFESPCFDHYAFMDLRASLPSFKFCDVAYAGRAVALAQWHQNHQFCSKCGSGTTSIFGGAKRQCLQNPLHRHYPRTDPVIITLVILDTPTPTSDDTHTTRSSSNQRISKEKVLLGRSKGLPPGTLTCLSGFIDQGESIEEAVVREVKEESGVAVHSVEILGSQPWPIGRGGSCELMIGCIARTSSEALVIDYSEMEECRWVDKEEVLEALKNSLNPESPFINRGKSRGGGQISSVSAAAAAAGGGGGGAAAGGGESVSVGRAVQDNRTSLSSSVLYVPPPYAIAHHLLKYWAENKVETRGGHPIPQSNKL